MGGDLRGGGSDGAVVGLQALERLKLGVAGEERPLELVEFAGHVVVLVEGGSRKDGGEDLLGQDVLDQHLPHIGRGEAGVDGFLRVREERLRGQAELRVGLVRPLDHLAQRLEHGGKVGLELLDGFPELRYLGTGVAEEQAQELLERHHVVDGTAHHLGPRLDQDCLGRILEDDVVLRVAAALLERDLGVEVVLLVLGLPVAERQAQRVEQGAVHVPALLGRRLDLVLGNEDQVVRPRPSLEEVLEGLAHHGLAMRARDPVQILELVQVLLDEELAHALQPLAPSVVSPSAAGR